MPLARFYRLRRARLAAAPMVLQPALGWKGLASRWLCLLVVVALFGVAAAYWGYQHGRRDVTGGVTQLEGQVARVREDLAASRERESMLRQQLRVAESARVALEETLTEAQAETAQAREALAFFDSLLTSNDRARPVRFAACEFDFAGPQRWRYRILLVQGVDRTADLAGNLEISVQLKNAARQTQRLDASRQAISVRHYRRVEGEIVLPEGAKPTQMDARLMVSGDAKPIAQCEKKTGGV
ncbi:hypothetical protein GCM10007860_24730 [Chitiniphilus shinanonensis]|uniref:Uncharacterized protein n=1 Tax=Chitiniphilus shinanonensis TaxID=553088 RepID=A0ABQ6BV39_9NEIS|nr:DUF6776 family protein [Chitiniphilus shinanonensis]GLS05322.1 hypothetical protein GCM10007860_24730 [Chitiniphilus shinanonensis]